MRRRLPTGRPPLKRPNSSIHPLCGGPDTASSTATRKTRQNQSESYRYCYHSCHGVFQGGTETLMKAEPWTSSENCAPELPTPGPLRVPGCRPLGKNIRYKLDPFEEPLFGSWANSRARRCRWLARNLGVDNRLSQPRATIPEAWRELVEKGNEDLGTHRAHRTTSAELVRNGLQLVNVH